MKNTIFNQREIEVINNVISDYKAVDTSSKRLFSTFLAYFMRNKGTQRKQLLSNVTKGIHELGELPKHIENRLKKVAKIAMEYRKFNIKISSYVYYKNIEDIVKLLSFISENVKTLGTDAFPEAKEALEDAISHQDLTVVPYNNNISKMIADFKKKYGIKGDEDALSLSFSKIKGAVKALTKEQKEELLAMLQSELA